ISSDDVSIWLVWPAWRKIPMPDAGRGRYRTGDRSPASGRYWFDGYVNGAGRPRPEESHVAVQSGEPLPAMTGQPCWWRFAAGAPADSIGDAIADAFNELSAQR